MAAFTEKDFYLDEFRGRTLVLAVDRPALRGSTALRELRSVVGDLGRHGSRVVLVLGEVSDPPSARRWLGLPVVRTTRSAGAAGAVRRRGDSVTWSEASPDDAIAQIWQVLRVRPHCIVVCRTGALLVGCRVAERLRVRKLVVLDPSGGLREPDGRRALSFLDESTRDVLLSAGEAEFHGMQDRRGMLAEIDRVLENGVGSVNLCAAADLARELFTYEGAGTLFTRGDYCRVDRFGIDDFHEFERLVERGQKEGLLKPRTVEEIGELLLCGFGAWIGEGHLAGIGALWTAPYAAFGAGEITGLYTITRFKGERIGQRLVRRIIAEAGLLHLRYVFAVTTSDSAALFFRREGFALVGPEDVPAVKWNDYDPARRARARIFRLDLV